MMKLSSLALLGAAFLGSAAVAETTVPVAPACNFSGFYAGAVLGYDSGSLDVRNGTDGGVIASSGMTGGVVAGYGKELGSSRVYLGLQALALLSGEKCSVGGNVILKRFTFEVAPRFGIAMNNALLYVKAGWANSSFKYAGNKKSSNGFAVGLGTQIKISRNMFAGLEFTRTMYKKEQEDKTETASDGTVTTTSVSIKPVSNRFAIHVGYTF